MKSINKPMVSVTISAYNHENFVEKTILNIVNQSYGFENIELLTIDDCSTDNTGKILRELSERYHFTFIQNKKNIGVVKNKNTLLRMASGKYVAGCASDDYWHPEKIEKQVTLMETLGDEYAVCHTIAYIIDKNDKLLFFQNKGVHFQENIFPRILIDNGIVAPSTLIRRKVYNEIGFHDEKLLFEDREMWIRIGLRYKFAFINEPLVYRRQISNNLSRDMNSFYITHSAIFEKYKCYFEMYNLIGEYHYLMFVYMSASDFKISVSHLKKCKKLIFQKTSYRAFMKLFTPKILFSSKIGFKIRKFLKIW
ncbi:MAG: glycosyltransferase [Bacteroidales bacterium]|nr:glycosyltransferase [Bacteroidales bacterium]